MRINELIQVLTGLILLASSLECGNSDHVHLKIHIPDIVQKHKHVKTKYIHVFHPKVIHSHDSSLQYLHSRNDPKDRSTLINGGYPQPLITLGKRKPELRITEEEFLRWRQDQLNKALEQRKLIQDAQQHNDPTTEDDEEEVHETKTDLNEGEDEKYTNDLYKKHKANKANSSFRKDSSKHKNHNYNQDYEATNSDKAYANYPTRFKNKRQPQRGPQTFHHQSSQRPRKNPNPPKNYGYFGQQTAEPSNLQPQFYQADPPLLDPYYYSTLPKDQETESSDNQDEIYSGLLSSRYNQNTAEKSRILGDINYNRKHQTKIFASNRRTQ